MNWATLINLPFISCLSACLIPFILFYFYTGFLLVEGLKLAYMTVKVTNIKTTTKCKNIFFKQMNTMMMKSQKIKTIKTGWECIHLQKDEWKIHFLKNPSSLAVSNFRSLQSIRREGGFVLTLVHKKQLGLAHGPGSRSHGCPCSCCTKHFS